MAGKGLSGKYGDMPIDLYLKKNEITLMHSPEEDEEQLNNFMRQNLIDYRDAPTQFEQDQTRYDNQSRRRLDIRHEEGVTYGTRPYLHDAFTDQIFLSDIGNKDLPNFQELRSQIDLRVRDQVQLYNDDDNSVPSKEKSAFEVIRDRDRLFRRAQDTFKIFDTSKDYLPFGNPIGKPLLGSSQKKKLIHDQVPNFMSEEATSNRNYQIDMSNKLPVGWQTTPDNVFKVAKYDTPRKMADMRTDSYLNRVSGKLDSDFLVSFEGKNIPRSLALTIMDIMRQRKLLEKFVKSSGTQYGKSNQDTNRKIKQLDDSMMELMRRYSDQSATTSANQLLKGENKNVSGERYNHKDDPYKIEKSLVGLQLFDMIKKATNNRKLGKQESQDLRDEIIETATSDALYNEDKNRQYLQTDKKNEMLWQSLAEHKRNEQMAVFNYAGVRSGKNAQMAGSHHMFDVAQYDRLENPDLKNRRAVTDNNMYLPNVLRYEKLNPVEAQVWNIGGSVNSPHTKNMVELDARSSDSDMNELNSMMHSQPGRITSTH